MTKIREELVEEFGEDGELEVFTLIKKTSPQELWVARMYMYQHIMRGDSLKDLSHNFFYSNSRIPNYFRGLIEKSRAGEGK